MLPNNCVTGPDTCESVIEQLYTPTISHAAAQSIGLARLPRLFSAVHQNKPMLKVGLQELQPYCCKVFSSLAVSKPLASRRLMRAW